MIDDDRNCGAYLFSPSQSARKTSTRSLKTINKKIATSTFESDTNVLLIIRQLAKGPQRFSRQDAACERTRTEKSCVQKTTRNLRHSRFGNANYELFLIVSLGNLDLVHFSVFISAENILLFFFHVYFQFKAPRNVFSVKFPEIWGELQHM